MYLQFIRWNGRRINNELKLSRGIFGDEDLRDLDRLLSSQKQRLGLHTKHGHRQSNEQHHAAQWPWSTQWTSHKAVPQSIKWATAHKAVTTVDQVNHITQSSGHSQSNEPHHTKQWPVNQTLPTTIHRCSTSHKALTIQPKQWPQSVKWTTWHKAVSSQPNTADHHPQVFGEQGTGRFCTSTLGLILFHFQICKKLYRFFSTWTS